MRSRNRQPRVIIFWALLICFLILGSVLLKFAVSFKKSTIRQMERISLVLADSRNEVIVFSLQGKEGLILNLDAEKHVQLPRGFGEYELAKVYPLGELEDKGGQLLKETVQSNLLTPIFGFFYDPSSFSYEQLKPKKFFYEVFKNSLTRKIKTDLRTIDLIILLLRSKLLDESEITILDSREDIEAVIEAEIEKTGPFKDRLLRGEGYSIEVLNSTTHPGLAQQASQLLERSGARVVRTADDSQARKQNFLIVSSRLRQSYTFSWLALVFEVETETSEEKRRADFTLVLGEEYGEEIRGKN